MKYKNVFPVFFSLMLFVMPASTNYEMHDYGIGGGGDTEGSSSNYGLNAMIGEIGGALSDGTNYSLGPGVLFTRQANVPAAPTFTNPSNFYNRLQITLDTGGNPSDARFAVAISSDNFVTTQYVKSDFTVGSTLSITDYQTYSGWGGGAGVFIVGLQPNTTYSVKVRAMHGKFTETGYSAVAMASTAPVSLTFDLDVSAVDTETAPPYVLNFGTLSPGVITTAGQKIWVDLETNAADGAEVYIRASTNGLTSVSASHTITSLTGNLGSMSQGYGMQVNTVGQASGGPLTVPVPYNFSLDNIGELNAFTLRAILRSTVPVSGGRASFLLKAKSSTSTPAAADYSQVLTVVAAARF
jgi:hypothetical protein